MIRCHAVSHVFFFLPKNVNKIPTFTFSQQQSPKPEVMNITDFPDELLLHIFASLDIEDLHRNVALVCQRFLRLSRVPPEIKCLKLVGFRARNKDYVSKAMEQYSNVRALSVHLIFQGRSGDEIPFLTRVLDLSKTMDQLQWLKITGLSQNTTIDDLVTTLVPKETLRKVKTLDLLGYTSIRKYAGYNDLTRDFRTILTLCNKLENVFLRRVCLQFLDDLVVTCGPHLRKLHVAGFTDSIVAPDSAPKWSHWNRWIQHLTYIHMPFSTGYWTFMSSLENLRHVGIAFDQAYPGNTLVIPDNLELEPVRSKTIHSLDFQGN